MRVLTVLDSFGTGKDRGAKVYIYDVEGLVNEYEDFIESRGHILSCCQWLVTDTLPALYVPGVCYEDDSDLEDEGEYETYVKI